MAAPPRGQACSLYVNDNSFVVVCSHQEKSWIYKPGYPMVRLTRDVDTALLGSVIIGVLSKSRQGLPDTNWRTASRPEEFKFMLRFAGFPNYARFQYANTCVSIWYDFNKVHFDSYRRERSSYIGVGRTFSAEYEPDAVGKCALRAIKVAE